MEQNNNGKTFATVSLVLGIISLIVTFFINGLVGVIVAIVGIVMASQAKKRGFVGGIRTAGFVLNLIALIVGVVFFVIVFACAAALIGAGMLY